MTRQDIICNKLIRDGFKEVKNPKTTKYRVFKFSRRDGVFYFVGKNGALRKGTSVSESISLMVNPKLFEEKK